MGKVLDDLAALGKMKVLLQMQLEAADKETKNNWQNIANRLGTKLTEKEVVVEMVRTVAATQEMVFGREIAYCVAKVACHQELGEKMDSEEELAQFVRASLEEFGTESDSDDSKTKTELKESLSAYTDEVKNRMILDDEIKLFLANLRVLL